MVKKLLAAHTEPDSCPSYGVRSAENRCDRVARTVVGWLRHPEAGRSARPLDRVRDGVARVGVTENAPWVELRRAAEPSGSEPELVADFAAQLGAEVEWTDGSEAVLMNALERGDLDVVLGGFLEGTPWVEKGATTLPCTELPTSRSPKKQLGCHNDDTGQIGL